MGNKTTKAGDISISLESGSDWFSPGDEIIGTVTTNVLEHYEAKHLEISLIGMEHLQVISVDDDSQVTYYQYDRVECCLNFMLQDLAENCNIAPKGHN